MFTLISYFFKLFHKFHYNKLVEFEYHEADFEIRFSEEQKQNLLKHYGKA
jgi:hypothetical protein